MQGKKERFNDASGYEFSQKRLAFLLSRQSDRLVDKAKSAIAEQPDGSLALKTHDGLFTITALPVSQKIAGVDGTCYSTYSPIGGGAFSNSLDRLRDIMASDYAVYAFAKANLTPAAFTKHIVNSATSAALAFQKEFGRSPPALG